VKTAKFILLIAIAFALVSCKSKMKITSNFDRSVNFGNFKTFTFVEPSKGDMAFFKERHPKIVNEVNIDRLREAIIREMELKGYVLSDNGDITVSYLVMLQTNTKFQSSRISAGTTPSVVGFGGGGWGGIGGENIVTANYRTGALIINVVDSRTNNLVWFGTASGVMAPNPNKSFRRIPIKVTEIFSRYYWVAGQSEPVTPPPAQ
jgi:hypothetical protein